MTKRILLFLALLAPALAWADVTGLVTPGGSGTTDASALTTGTLACARLPSFTSDFTTSGCVATLALGVSHIWTAAQGVTLAGQAANTSLSGFSLINSTLASSGNQQYSPSFLMEGEGWKSAATAASQPVDAFFQVVPVQGTTFPTGTVYLRSLLNGANAEDIWSFSFNGTAAGTGNFLYTGNTFFNGEVRSTTGLRSAYLINTGTTFAAAGTGCTISTKTGAASAGTFTLASGPCTSVQITMGASATAPTGWACQAHDRTAPTVLIGGESASTTTTATISIPAGAGTSDVISFSCTGF